MIPFGTTITCPSYRYHPLYPGRVFLGVGTGEAFNEQPLTGQFGDFQERLDRLAEAIDIIRELWTGEWTSYSGRYFQIHQARLYDLPPRPVPLLVAGSGPKSACLAGQHGDGWITDANSIGKPELVQSFREARKSAGRDDNGRVMVEQFVVVGGADEAHEAARLWRFPANRLQ